ncbi:hypothetical protein NL676_027837 [Syzygium grande]|nr:hypothetical protein NL676_027837 [Syzygium grande]
MKKLALSLMELLAISLGLERSYYRDFFKDGCSIMRCNSYPPCQEPSLVLGTGPHCDPTSLTILHQDQVGGFDKRDIQELPAPSGGELAQREAVVGFLPVPAGRQGDRAGADLAHGGARKYPDFTWSDLLRFTQKHYRADQCTLPKFTEWFLSLQDRTLDC